jgi:hypothetical protein
VSQDDPRKQSSPPYATGGGGVVLEHAYGATLLAALLSASPVAFVGENVTIEEVRFQGGNESSVDDFLVIGSLSDGTPRTVAIAVRRRPHFTASDADFVALMANVVHEVDQHWSEVVAGTRRVGLVVAAPNGAAEEAKELAAIAREIPDPERFRNEIFTPGRRRQQLRDRLDHLENVVRAAAPERDARELTWRALSALFVSVASLEGEVAADRTTCIANLQLVTESLFEASELFGRLCRLADRYAPDGAIVTEASLRRDLVGVMAIGRSLRHTSAWAVLDRLGELARELTKSTISGVEGSLSIERGYVLQALGGAMSALKDQPVLLVTGEPDVGKSALALRAADSLQASGAAITVLNLRDLPRTTVELEHVLGAPLAPLLGSERVASMRAVLIDGAEAMLEGWGSVLPQLASAALSAGLSLILVTRRDAADAITSSLARIDDVATPFTVPPFDTAEARQVTATFGSLARFATDPRSAWLLGRPGLIDLLIKADAVANLPDGSLSEADVFLAVWNGLVRRGEQHGPDDPSPDARDQAMIAIASTVLGEPPIEIADRSVLASLRSDGALLAQGRAIAWSTGDQFASDLVRDFAVARLFIVQGFEPIRASPVPRWATRAAILALQALLLQSSDIARTCEELTSTFRVIATEHGERWSDVVDEALLTLGTAPEVIETVWPSLIDNEGRGLGRLLRIIEQRFTLTRVADPLVAGPVIDACLSRAGDCAKLPYQLRERIEDNTLAHLRGLAVRRIPAGEPLRIRIRESALNSPEARRGSVERLGLLGEDLDEHAAGALRSIAGEQPHLIEPIVESPVASFALVNTQPTLLLELAEAYYVEQPQPPHHGFWSPIEDGVRDHHTGHVGHPWAGRDFGPFHFLLQRLPLETIAFINRMLDHAATVRVERAYANRGQSGPPGPSITLPGGAVRVLAGDSDTWSWYRGIGIGPNPCMSALLAVEALADSWRAQGAPLVNISSILLEGCNNLAMAGLVVGFLVRHLGDVTTDLDGYLEQPVLWNLEFQRINGEHFGLRAQRDDPSAIGFERRRHSFMEVACAMVVAAILAGDDARIAALNYLGDRLVANATGADGTTNPTVERWASSLRAENYELVEFDGMTGYQLRVPQDVDDALADEHAELALGNEAMRLANAYTIVADRRPTDLATLEEDVASAQHLSDNLPPTLGRIAADAIDAVAATAVIAHAEGRVDLSPDQLDWAGSLMVSAFAQLDGNDLSYGEATPRTGGDRSAAIAVPLLLAPRFHEDSAGRPAFSAEECAVVAEALHLATTNPYDEVRRNVGTATKNLWAYPCHVLATGQCRHEVAYEAVEAGLRDCQYGPWTYGQRTPVQLEGDLINGLREVGADDVIVSRLTGPLVALSAATASHCCIAERSQELFRAALHTYRRGIISWLGKGYSLPDEGQSPIVDVMVNQIESGQFIIVEDHLAALTEDPEALWKFLRLLLQCATCDAKRRTVILGAWPRVMATLIDGVAEGRDPRSGGTERTRYRRSLAMAALIPRPTLPLNHPNPDAALENASANWIPIAAIRSEVERWLPLVVGSSDALDDLVCYLETQPAADQLEPGLSWVEALVAGRYGMGRQSWHASRWFGQLRDRTTLAGDRLRRFRALVDGFVAGGDARFVPLQRADETGNE